MRRRITPREAARLQGFPDWFDFGSQPDAATYKQLGNGVNVGAAYHVFREHVLRDADDVGAYAPHVAEAVLASPPNVDELLVNPFHTGPLAMTAQGGDGGAMLDAGRKAKRHAVLG